MRHFNWPSVSLRLTSWTPGNNGFSANTGVSSMSRKITPRRQRGYSEQQTKTTFCPERSWQLS